MRFICLGSSSQGNGYILIADDGSALAIEAGAPAPEYINKGALPSQFAGVLITHEHGDHAASALRMVAQYGIKPIATQGTFRALGLPLSLGHPVISFGECMNVRGWKITALRVVHDAAEPCAFIIERDGMKALFATDLAEFPLIAPELLKGLNVVMLEANYDAEVAIRTGASRAHLDRVAASHLSIAQAERAIAALQDHPINTIILLHLSNDNSDAAQFRERITAAAPFARVYVADKGLTIENLNLW